jgi:hypothetical protein
VSDFRAIGGTSATLQTLLSDRMELPSAVASAPVTIGPPPFSSMDTNPRKEDARVNIFLYRVTENGYLQNQQIPGRGTNGFGHPPLSVNLHYLITAYGNTQLAPGPGPAMFDDTIAHFLLGSAMRVLHDVPIVTDSVRTQRAPSGRSVLHESLRAEYEQVKLSLEPLSLEDITKVWTALSLRFRLSAGYLVNVLQIESRRPRTFPRPVGQPVSTTVGPLPTDPPSPGPMIVVRTIQTPTITGLKVIRLPDPTEHPFPYARVLDTVVLLGTSLSGPVTNVEIGDVVVPAALARSDRVEVAVPDANLPSGPIPPDLQLQPGPHTLRVLVSDPSVPQAVMTSNDAALMIVPFVDPALLGYAAGPPRTLTIQGTRLLGVPPSGETVIGRAAVSAGAYVTATPTQLVVPIPDALPAQGVGSRRGSMLAPAVPLGPGAKTLDVNIAGTIRTVTANLAGSIPREGVAQMLAGLIHDAGTAPITVPDDPRFTGARVDLWHDRLLVVPGGLTGSVDITSPGGLSFAGDLGLTAAQPPGTGSAAVSGALDSPPPLSAPAPRLTVRIGLQPPVVVDVPKATSLAALADDLQAAINAASPLAEYASALVGVTGSQLLFIPGVAAAPVVFGPAPGDDTTVAELQLHARFAVRVRVNGAESIDEATLELPQ